MVEMRAELKV